MCCILSYCGPSEKKCPHPGKLAGPSVLEMCGIFLLAAAAVLNTFVKAKKAKFKKHTFMEVLMSFQVKCLLWVKAVNTGIALWVKMTCGSSFIDHLCTYC